jgi:4-aminobutyrate aminotransferase-like enzyme
VDFTERPSPPSPSLPRTTSASRAAELGAFFLESLEALRERHPLIGEVRGRGLLVAVELVLDRATKEPAAAAAAQAVAAMLRRGLMNTMRGGAYGNCLRMAPALTITRQQLAFAAQAIDESLEEVETSL